MNIATAAIATTGYSTLIKLVVTELEALGTNFELDRFAIDAVSTGWYFFEDGSSVNYGFDEDEGGITGWTATRFDSDYEPMGSDGDTDENTMAHRVAAMISSAL